MIYTKDRAEHPDVISLRESYFRNEECCIDVKIKVIYEDESDSITSQYIGFCKVFDDCRKKYGYTRKTIDETLRICADKNLLKKYLKDHEAEVIEMMTLLFDQDYVTEAYNNEIRQNALNEGIGIGEARGRTEGIFTTLSGLVKDGILTVPQAAERMNISASEFRQRAGSLL
ncbi:MAG: hypothetical protein Q4E17_07445 [Synergistes sp.]|nr:hypothetical protein [Synergistes sp.]